LSDLAALLDQLDEVQTVKDGREYWTLCPCHDDHNPSLSVTRIEGSMLLRCHAGCAAEDILSALSLTKAELADICAD